MKTTLLAALAGILAGAALGGAMAASVLGARLTETELEHQALSADAAILKSERDRFFEELEYADLEKSRLEQQLAMIQDDLRSARAKAHELESAIVYQPHPDAIEYGLDDMNAFEQSSAFDQILTAVEQAAPEAGDDGARRGRDREEMDGRRREAFRVARERMDEFMNESIANAKSVAEQQRLASIRDHMDYMTELMQQGRQMETEEDREAYREAIQATRDTVRGLVRAQQDDMMRDVARQHGITDPRQQEAFVQALRSTQNSPMFRAPMLTSGGTSWGGFYGGGGGRGGPPSPGGGGGRR